MEITSGIIIGFIICYIICMMITMNIISNLIQIYDSFYHKSHNIISVKLIEFIKENKQKIILYGAWLFPITIGISIGAFLGSIAYNKILAKTNEDRIIPWLF